MGTPTEARYAEFRVPLQKGTTDSGGDGKEFSQRRLKQTTLRKPGKDAQKERAETRRQALTATTLEGRGLTSVVQNVPLPAGAQGFSVTILRMLELVLKVKENDESHVSIRCSGFHYRHSAVTTR
ncbi:hypothetical protein NDU88_002677 [Pleurodeles waltl]|uniref:Uncharacterized protein n=1 Tax=Pleurodeles waltl TaxID=8319 RepID=A0AAV7T380_PLEWA|nr:hypothetical protein NDU88_002677 [Pleurodeles waltl]